MNADKEVDEDIINYFFDNFENKIENVAAYNIFNMDEAGLHENPASKYFYSHEICGTLKRS